MTPGQHAQGSTSESAATVTGMEAPCTTLSYHNDRQHQLVQWNPTSTLTIHVREENEQVSLHGGGNQGTEVVIVRNAYHLINTKQN